MPTGRLRGNESEFREIEHFDEELCPDGKIYLCMPALLLRSTPASRGTFEEKAFPRFCRLSMCCELSLHGAMNRKLRCRHFAQANLSLPAVRTPEKAPKPREYQWGLLREKRGQKPVIWVSYGGHRGVRGVSYGVFKLKTP